jgi:formylglycine-generating enzyme required for sulfatase activity
VGAFIDGRNPHGLLNMAGNVWELTADHYTRDAYQQGYLSEGKLGSSAGASQQALAFAVRPRGPLEGELRVIRGGSYAAPAHELRTTERASVPEGEPRPDIGFRCAYHAPQKSQKP